MIAVGVTRTTSDAIFIQTTSPQSHSRWIPRRSNAVIEMTTRIFSSNQPKGTKSSVINEENATVVEILSFWL